VLCERCQREILWEKAQHGGSETEDLHFCAWCVAEMEADGDRHAAGDGSPS